MADFGEILRNIGEFGLFQKILLMLLCSINLIESFITASFIFIESDPDRHCKTDWIRQADSNLTTEEQLNLTLPREEDGTFSRCRMFVPVDWDIGDIREYGLNQTTGCQDGWVYSSTLYKATIVTDFDLVCENANLVQVLQAVYMSSLIVGSAIFGPFADSFGRKRAIEISAVIMFTFTVTTALSPNAYFYIASQFLVGAGAGAYQMNSVSLVTEWIGPSKRSWGTCVSNLFGAVGFCVLAGVAYFIRNWRLIQLIGAAPLAVLVIYIWFIPESARWLLSRGRREEAKQLIVKAAAVNKTTVPDSLLEEISIKDTANKGSIKDIFRSPRLTRYLVVVSLAWCSMNMAFVALYLNSGNFGLSIFLTQFLFGAVEIPAVFLTIWLLEVFGRRILFISTLLTGGLACLLILAVPQGYAIAVTFLVVLARFILNWAGSTCFVYMQELFPTSIRQTATAFGTMSAKTGSLLAPLINILAVYHWVIPNAVFGSLTVIGGALGFVLPETRRKELPESVDEAENNRYVSSMKTKSLNQQSTKL